MLYTINVTNNSATDQSFYFFQKPASFMSSATVYSNSIFCQMLQPYSRSGAVLTFLFQQQYCAGAQTSIQAPTVGQASGYTTASQPIELTESGKPSNNTTLMSVEPSLGLAPAVYTAGVPVGAFRIVTPQYNAALVRYNTGLAIKNLQYSTVVLSSFITAEPGKNIDCLPTLVFYVQTGSYQAGTTINFAVSAAGAALCDTSSGFTTFDVSYNIDGSWTVTAVLHIGGRGGRLAPLRA